MLLKVTTQRRWHTPKWTINYKIIECFSSPIPYSQFNRDPVEQQWIFTERASIQTLLKKEFLGKPRETEDKNKPERKLKPLILSATANIKCSINSSQINIITFHKKAYLPQFLFPDTPCSALSKKITRHGTKARKSTV